jgi:hypothetical protein
MNKDECGKQAMSLMYWPGNDPLPICADHQAWAVKVAGAMGLYLRFEKAPIDAKCNQAVEKSNNE